MDKIEVKFISFYQLFSRLHSTNFFDCKAIKVMLNRTVFCDDTLCSVVQKWDED